MEGESEKEILFFFQSGMNLPAEIRYKSPVQLKLPGTAGIFFRMKLPCFCTGIGTDTINFGRTGRYGKEGEKEKVRRRKRERERDEVAATKISPWPRLEVENVEIVAGGR